MESSSNNKTRRGGEEPDGGFLARSDRGGCEGPKCYFFTKWVLTQKKAHDKPEWDNQIWIGKQGESATKVETRKKGTKGLNSRSRRDS